MKVKVSRRLRARFLPSMEFVGLAKLGFVTSPVGIISPCGGGHYRIKHHSHHIMSSFRFAFSIDENKGDRGSITETNEESSTTAENQEVVVNKLETAKAPPADQSTRDDANDDDNASSDTCITKSKQQLLSLVELPSHSQSSELSYNTVQINEEAGYTLHAVRESATACQKEKVGIDDIDMNIDKTHDVITGVYEGGLKVWECSVDLCRYLFKHHKDLLRDVHTTTSSDDSVSVLELGCGHGLPGCLLLKEWAAGNSCFSSSDHDHHAAAVTNDDAIATGKFHMLFSDFNEFVLEHVTAHNVNRNTTTCDIDMAKSGAACCWTTTLVAGDWMALSNALFDGTLTTAAASDGLPIKIDCKFDVILAAETTYTKESAEATAMLFARHLSCPRGVGLVANKRYYFGVGGGSDVFCAAITASSRGNNKGLGVPNTSCTSNNGTEYELHVETVEELDNGAGNIREILRVEWRERRLLAD